MSESKKKIQSELYEERVSQAKVVRKIVFFCIVVFLIIGAIGLISGYSYLKNALNPIDEKNPKDVEVTIPIGSGSSQIGQILEDEGLIRNGKIFRYYVKYKNEAGFQAGDYTLSTGMSVEELVEELKDGKVLQEAELAFTVPEGRWLIDVIQLISEQTDLKVEDMMELMNDEEYIRQLIDKYPMLTEDILDEQIRYPLEGYLFPARYEFMTKTPSFEEIIEKMLGQTAALYDQFSAEIENSEYSFHELMTLASIIEREAQTSEDRYIISGVLYNRLKEDMMLQVDPTVAYAIGEHRYMTTFADLEKDSPYNTYKYKGIPIGPIANPGKDSIQAAMQPEETNYLYFYARYNGEVIYTETYEEHNAVHQKYRHEWVEAEEKNENN